MASKPSEDKLAMSLDEISNRAKNQAGTPPPPLPSPATASTAAGSTNKIFISNLPYSTSWQDLKDIFKQVGPVAHAKILSGPGGRSKGVGVVEFQNTAHVAAAIKEYNGAELAGRQLLVREDRPNPRVYGSVPMDDGGMKRKRGPGAEMTHTAFQSHGGSGKKLFVGNLPYETTWQDLKDVFKSVGPVAHVEILTGPGGRSKGAATVEFVTSMGAKKAISKFNAAEINGRPIVVRMDRADPGAMKRVRHNVNSPGLTVTLPGAGGAGVGAGAGAGARLSGGAPGTTLYVGNIPYEMTWQILKDLIKEVAPVVRVEVVTGPNGRSRGYALVQMATAEGAELAILKLNNYEIEGRTIFVRLDKKA